MENKLTKISIEDFIELRDLFKIDWPKHVVSFATLATLIAKCYTNPECLRGVEVLCLNGNWKRDGTFIIHLTVRENSITEN